MGSQTQISQKEKVKRDIKNKLLEIKELDDRELERLHILTHFHDLCGLHKDIALELGERGYPHIVRNLCDEVIELLKNIKTYDAKNVGNAILRDDWRIIKAWLSTLNKGKKFTSSQFKEYSLERQKQIVRRLAKSIRAEMKRRGWKPSESKLGRYPHKKKKKKCLKKK